MMAINFQKEEKKKLYNSDMCLYVLNNYIEFKRIPEQLIDVNIASDYSKLGKMLDLCKGEEREKVIEQTVAGKGIVSEIRQKFNPTIEFTETDLVSMLFYLGYLTITGDEVGYPILNIPNNVMKEIYSDYFLRVLNDETKLDINENYSEIAREIAIEGKIDKIIELLGRYLKSLSNRDFVKFDEKYVKLIFFCISMNLKVFRVKSEMEVQKKYPDILLIPRDTGKGYKGIMIEFKYLKKEDKSKLKEKQKEAKKQIQEYGKFEEIKELKNIYKYTVIAVNDELYVEKVD